METGQKLLYLILLCLVLAMAGYGVYVHGRNKTRPPSELKTGVQVLTDPESVVKDLEK
jgi:hypothetical protein